MERWFRYPNRRFFPAVFEESNYKENKRDGEMKLFDLEGKLIFKGNFIDVNGKKLRPMPILVKGTYQERVEANKEWIDNSAFGKWIKRNELSSREKELLKKGDVKGAFEEVQKRKDESQ